MRNKGLIGILTDTVFGTIGKIAVIVLVLAALVWTAFNYKPLLNFLQGKGFTTISSGVVVTQIQGMSHLVTARFDSQVDVEVDRPPTLGFIPSDKLLVRAKGTIVAGIDLSRITERDVIVNGSEVTIHLPPAAIISQDITYEPVALSEGVLPGVDAELQPAAEAQAREELLSAACEYGLLQKAEEQSQIALGDLLKTLDVETVHFVQTNPLPGDKRGCP